MFIKLGILNSKRQLARSLLVLLAMALSAVSLTSAMSLSEGAMASASMTYREILGGEIVAFPVRWVGQQSTDINGNAVLHYHRLERNRLSWMEWLYPELYDKGYLSHKEVGDSEFFDPADLLAMQQVPGITGISVIPQLPASIAKAGNLEHGLQVAVMPAPPGYLPGRGFSAEQEAAAAPVAITNSHFFVSKDQLSAIASLIPDNAVGNPLMPPPFDEVLRLKDAAAERQIKDNMQLPKLGDTMTLLLPELLETETGGLLPNFSNQSEISFQLISRVSIPTRTIAWLNELGGTERETAYLHAPVVWVPQSTWNRLWSQAAGDRQYRPSNVALQVENMEQLDNLVIELQSRFPEYTFVDVPKLQQRAENLTLLDRFFRAPPYMWQLKGQSTLAVPLQLGKVMGILMYLVSGMLIASRMLTGASARRKEVGVLKALGARRKDITVMALTEAFLITIIGSSAGFALVRVGALAKQLSNDVPFSIILNSTVSEYAMVVGVATAVSMLFALIPAVRMANLTVMEVLRND